MTVEELAAEIACDEGIDFDECRDEFPHRVIEHDADRGWDRVFVDGSAIVSDGHTWWARA